MWESAFVECIMCKHRWASVWPDVCTLEMIECPVCGNRGVDTVHLDIQDVIAINKRVENSEMMVKLQEVGGCRSGKRKFDN